MLQQHVVKGFQRLVAQRRAVHQKQNALEALRLEQAVDQANDGARLARASRHGQQAVGLALRQRAFYGADGFDLVVTQAQVGVAFGGKHFLRLGKVALEHVQQPFGRVEVLQRLGEVGAVAQITKPCAAGFFMLLHKGAAIARISKGNGEVRALPVFPGLHALGQLPRGLHAIGR